MVHKAEIEIFNY